MPEKHSRTNLRNFNLGGDLDLEGFPRLKVYLAGNPRLGEIRNKPRWTILIYQNSHEFLNHQYSQKEQVEIINLKNLEFEQPELIIDNYPNLKGINGAFISNLTQLTITNCPQLEEIIIKKSNNHI